MQRKKNIQLLVTLVILVMATVVTYFFTIHSFEQTVDKSIFRVEELKSIDRVVLEKTSGSSIELKLEGTRWRVNDQPADLNMVDVLFATIQQAEPKRPVAASLRDSISKELIASGVKVSLFEGGSLQKVFIAGGNTSKTQAYFKDPEQQDVFVMVIPGYRVYTSGIFELDENGWRDKYVFNFNWKNFKQLTATFPRNPAQNFEVAMGKEYFEVKGIAQADTARLNDFLDAISLITVDRYASKSTIENFESTVAQLSLMDIQVSDISGKTYSLALYDNGADAPLLALVQGTMPAYLDRQKAIRILKEKSWFAKK